jgi:hypothetical protein
MSKIGDLIQELSLDGADTLCRVISLNSHQRELIES